MPLSTDGNSRRGTSRRGGDNSFQRLAPRRTASSSSQGSVLSGITIDSSLQTDRSALPSVVVQVVSASSSTTTPGNLRSSKLLKNKETSNASSSSSAIGLDPENLKLLKIVGIAYVLLTILSFYSVVHLQQWTQRYSPSSQGDFDDLQNDDDSQVSSTLHFCTRPEILVQSDPIRANNETKAPLQLQYQCQGTAYDNFSRKLHDFADDKAGRTTTWGRRIYPLPANSNVLFFGNSHLRQVSKTAICQYAHQIRSLTMYSSDIFRIQFVNNATWTSITNAALVYSNRWQKLLEEQLGQPLEQLDGIVLGKFTSYQEARGTNYEKTMKEEERQYSGRVNFTSISPPTLSSIAQVYGGPLVGVSMFSQQYESEFLETTVQAIQTLRQVEHRTNLYSVNARAYVGKLELECGSDDRWTVGTCHEVREWLNAASRSSMNANTRNRKGRSPADMHRCTGALGGHADLISWDIIELLYTALSTKQTNHHRHHN